MPNITNESTLKAIATAFCSNGRKQEKAMITVGYSAAYANSFCGKVWENMGLKAEIERIDAESAEKAGMTTEIMRKQYDEDRTFARECNSASAAVSASIATARLYGMDKDASVDPHQKEIDEAKLLEAKRLASIRLREIG